MLPDVYTFSFLIPSSSLLTTQIVLCCQLIIPSTSWFPLFHYSLLNLFCVASCLYLLLPHSLQFITHYSTCSVLPAVYTFSFLIPSSSLLTNQIVLCCQLVIHSPSSFPPVHYSLLNLFCAASCLDNLLSHSLKYITHYTPFSLLPAVYTFSFLLPSRSLPTSHLFLWCQLFKHAPSSFPPVHYSLLILFRAASCL